MALSGRVEDLSMLDLLQLLAQSRKSGTLTMTRDDGEAKVVLREGRIIYAASSGVRDTLGNILVRRGLVDQDSLHRALVEQRHSREEVRLGTVLVDMGAVRPEQLEQVIHDQTRAALEEILNWSDGFFGVELHAVENHGEVEIEALDLLSSGGFCTQKILLDVIEGPDEGESERTAGGASSLGESLRVQRPPSLGAESTLTFLQTASARLDRGLLLAVQGVYVRPVGRFGQSAARRESLREPRLALAEPSLLLEAFRTRRVVQGRTRAGDRELLEQFGLSSAIVGLAFPIRVGGAVALLFYGDNQPSGRAIVATDELELGADELGLAIASEYRGGRWRDANQDRATS